LIKLNHTLSDNVFVKKLRKIRRIAKESNMVITKIDYCDVPHWVVDTEIQKDGLRFVREQRNRIMREPQALIYLESKNG